MPSPKCPIRKEPQGCGQLVGQRGFEPRRGGTAVTQRSDQAGFDGYPHDTSEENQPCEGLQGDARLREELTRWLAERGQLDGTHIDVHVQDGGVILRGEVRDAFQKDLAEDLVRAAQGVREIRNELRVGPEVPRPVLPANGGSRVVDAGYDGGGIGGGPGPGALLDEAAGQDKHSE
nr:BON domain-containing protein [Deinococcus sp. DB0503]